MNGAQLHLALNHAPLFFSIAGLLVALWGWRTKNMDVKLVGLGLIILAALFACMTFFTGEPAEDVLKNLSLLNRDLVHEHEEAGESALIASLVAGGLAFATGYWLKTKHRWARSAFMITLLLSMISTLSFFRTAHLGGVIRHEEIRN